MSTDVLSTTPLADTFGRIVQGHGGDLLDQPVQGVRDLFLNDATLLFRGFDPDTDTFVAFTELFCRDFSSYEGGGFRWGALNRESINNLETLMTTTGSTQGFPLPLHGEMYYLKRRPEIVWFYCANPPSANGETTLCDGAAVYRELSSSTRQFLNENRIKYVRYLPDGEWQTTFQTEDIDRLADIARDNDLNVTIGDDRSVTAEYVISAVLPGEDLTAPVFINNLVLVDSVERAFTSGWVAKNLPGLPRNEAPIIVRLEDGSRVPDTIVDELDEVTGRLTVDVAWQKGDILMIDNTKVMHGRRGYSGTDRAIYVRMGQLDS